MTKRLQKPFKRKQKLCDKFLKSKTNKNVKKYKTCKLFFKILKEKSKKIYLSRKLDSCKQNMKKTWDTTKKVIGKTKIFKKYILERMVIDGLKTFN